MRRRQSAKSTPPPERERAQHLEAAMKAMAAFKPAREVLTPVRAVPTCFVQLDHALRVGGWPLERIAGIHGPTHEGKTFLVLTLVRSFVERDHFVLYVDVEQTTDIAWASSLLGSAVDSPFFKASRTAIYEDVVEEVRTFLETIAKLRVAGHIPPDTGALVVIDSLRKLVPRDLYKKVAAGEGGSDGASGRAGMIRAKHNAAWMDELTPLASRTGGAVVFVLREHENTNTSQFAPEYKVGGGQSVQFDSSLLMRVTRAAWVGMKGEDDKPGPVYGERHRVTIKKSKVAGKEGRFSTAYFHSSNGILVPAGHDRARDVIDLARRFGIVTTSGAWFSWNKQRLGQGEHRAVVNLTEDIDMLAALEAEVRATFERVEPITIDENTGEID